MRRGLIHAGAWLLATGAAVTLSWWGVHTVMAGTVYDPPRALPIPSVVEERGGSTAGPAKPRSSATPRPSPTPTAKKPTTPPPASRPPEPPPTRTAAPPSRPAQAGGDVKAVSTEAGRVVFSMGRDSAKLLSATPEPGWAMQVWKNPVWIRVDFTQGGETVSVFCTWHDHPPLIETSTS
ncbi:hypothetical protein ACFYVL_22105 [Streptomyces sp. NPDC004111]|uniref:hypothetical protein n=1 Tax=Streptomyces sp. NPDC004111 TaxID=3364690 RepID=UPI0036942531